MELLLLNVHLRQISLQWVKVKDRTPMSSWIYVIQNKLGLCVKVSENDAFKARVGMEDALER